MSKDAGEAGGRIRAALGLITADLDGAEGGNQVQRPGVLAPAGQRPATTRGDNRNERKGGEASQQVRKQTTNHAAPYRLGPALSAGIRHRLSSGNGRA